MQKRGVFRRNSMRKSSRKATLQHNVHTMETTEEVSNFIETIKSFNQKEIHLGEFWSISTIDRDYYLGTVLPFTRRMSQLIFCTFHHVNRIRNLT